MSKLDPHSINFNNNNFVVEIKGETEFKKDVESDMLEAAKQEADIIINRAKEQANEILTQAQAQADNLISSANSEIQTKTETMLEDAKKEADEILNSAQKQANEITETSKKDADEFIKAASEKIEQERIEITKKGYEEGYNDGVEKIREELSGKIEDFDKFFKSSYELKDKIIKAASKDILDIIVNISSKILLKELDNKTLDKIIKNAITKFENKENINIILSEKYARLLFELQNNYLHNDEYEFDFDKFKKYDNFDVIYNPKYDDDTIIVENLKERFDASINSQLDVIVREIYEKTKNGQLDLENYIEDETQGTQQDNK